MTENSLRLFLYGQSIIRKSQIPSIMQICRKFRLICVLLFTGVLGPLFSYAQELDRAPVLIESSPVALLPFNSPQGLQRLMNASAKADFAELANQFEAQSNRAFCGPTTAAIILNAIYGRVGPLPRDRSRIQPDDLKNLPPGFDLTVPRFTQETVIQQGKKTRAQVLGEPILINGTLVRDGGYQLRQFDELLRAHQLKTTLIIVSEQMDLAAIREDFKKNLQTDGDYLVVNYQRQEIGQTGGAHISPVGAYDKASDSVLILDVNPAAHGWIWVPFPQLVKAMNTFDKIENRGYVLIEKN